MQARCGLPRCGGRAAGPLRRAAAVRVRCAAAVQSVSTFLRPRRAIETGPSPLSKPSSLSQNPTRRAPPLFETPPETKPKQYNTKQHTQPTASSTTPALSNLDRVSILAEALPYMQRFAGKTVVVKYGGAAMKDPSLKARVITDLVLLWTVGIRPVLVHGGGPEINSWLGKLGIEAEFKNGLRVTDGASVFFFLVLWVFPRQGAPP